MFKINKASAPKRVRDGLTSYCLLARGDNADNCLAVTVVDVDPGGSQIPHNHPEVQMYYILQGAGLMQVGEERASVEAGDIVYVPSEAMHGIENTGEGVLSYLSAANPAFDFSEAYDRGQLTEEAYRKGA